MKKYAYLTLFICFLLVSAYCPAKTWWYVKPDALGDQSGYSWENAFLRFEDALAVAQYGDEIELCQGTFRPDTTGFVDPREAAFVIPAGVLIEGGHEGIENGGWNPDVYVTILSADLNADDSAVADANELATVTNRTDNAYHIIDISGADPNTVFDGVNFKGGYADGAGAGQNRGGCAYGEGGGCSFVNCNFSENYASDNGGAIVCDSQPSLALTDCEFTLNAAKQGAAVYLDESGTANVTDCQFTNHLTTSGGAVSVDDNSFMRMDGCVFSQNQASSSGGAIRVSDNSTLEITDSAFSDNHATDDNNGGAISFYSSSMQISGSSFTDNTATADGGAINGDRSVCQINQSVFTGNSAETHGGAVKSYGCTMQLTACTFSSNTAVNSGGGVYGNSAGTENPTVLTAAHCQFNSNQARSGGGLMVSSSETEATVSNCTFEGNSVSNTGGGIANNDAHLDIEYCTFTSNQARDTGINGHGGAINYNSSDADGTVSDSIFIGNYAEFGGGASNANNSSPNFIRCVFKGNNGQYGGALHQDYAVSLIQNCLIVGNICRGGGGGVQSYQSYPTLVNCTIAENIADYKGGVATNGGQHTLINCIMWGNTDDSGNDDQYAQIDTGDLSNCCVQGWTGSLGGVGNFGDDPLFVQSGSWIMGANDSSFDDDIWIEGDYHLQSQAGSFSSSFLTWKADAQSSPCIDAGRTSDAFALEPMSNGGRINLGVYGNTTQASKSGTVFCDGSVTADITGDCKVNLLDLSLMAQNWLAGT